MWICGFIWKLEHVAQVAEEDVCGISASACLAPNPDSVFFKIVRTQNLDSAFSILPSRYFEAVFHFDLQAYLLYTLI